MIAGEENTTLLQRLRDLSTVEQQNFTLRKEVDNFKQVHTQFVIICSLYH